MFLSSLFVFLSIATAQPVADVPVQVTQHVSTTRYQFKYQENEYIIDLNAKRKILAYYINNELQNPRLLPSTQKELLQYDDQSKLDLSETFDHIQKRSTHQKEIAKAQTVAVIPVQVPHHDVATRYQFKYQEREHILDLNPQHKVLAYYINNKLQNPRLLPSIQKKLWTYDEKSKLDLAQTFDRAPRRTRRRVEAYAAAAKERRMARWRQELKKRGLKKGWVWEWRGSYSGRSRGMRRVWTWIGPPEEKPQSTPIIVEEKGRGSWGKFGSFSNFVGFVELGLSFTPHPVAQAAAKAIFAISVFVKLINLIGG